MASERHGGSLRFTEAPSHASAAGQALGLLLSRALSSRLPVSIIGHRWLWSSVVILQLVVDVEVLLDQGQTAFDEVCSFLRCEPLNTAMADAIILAEVTIDRVETVVSLASDDVRLFAFGVSLPANDPLMSQSCSHVMECGASWNNGVGASLVLGQHLSDPLSATLSSSARSQLESNPPCLCACSQRRIALRNNR